MKMYENYLYALFRVLVGLLFLQHGVQKLFGIFGAAVPLAGLFGVAGIIEFVGGVFLTIGLFTRWTALVTGIQMLVAYGIVHFPQGWVPLQNQGELALLYFASFVVLYISGAGKWSVDARMKRRYSV